MQCDIRPWRRGSGVHEEENRDALTCRLMKLDVVSEEVLPSERLKRLLRLGNFLGSWMTHTHTFKFKFASWNMCCIHVMWE